MKLAMRVQAVSKKVTLITTAFVLAVSTLTAVVPFILSQDANAVSIVHTTSLPGDWYLGETRSAGNNELVSGGLHVWTTPSGGSYANEFSKAAGYHTANFDLSAAGTTSIDFAPGFSGVRPSLQLGVDKDNNGTWDGYLVYEPWSYGTGNWWSSKNFGINSGMGYASFGTLADYSAANPNAKVTSIGYSLGSGVVGDAVITAIRAGGTTYTFDTVPPDTQKPTIDLTSPTSTSIAAGTDLVFSATDNVGLSKIVANVYKTGVAGVFKPSQISLPGSVNGNLIVSTTGFTNGSYSVKYNATDTSSNVSSTHTFNFTVDNTLPVISVKGAAWGNIYTPSSVGTGNVFKVVNFKLFDNDKVKTVTVNGVNKAITASQWSDVNNIQVGSVGGQYGNNTIHVYDQAGNESKYDFVLDNVGPTVSFKSSPDTIGVNPYQKVSFKLFDQYKVARAEVNGFSIELADNIWSDLNNIVPGGAMHGITGMNTVKVWDIAGNVTEVSFVLDVTAPDASFAYSNNNGAAVTNQDVTVTMITTEEIQTPSTWTRGDATHYTKVYTANTKDSVTITDLAGNSSLKNFEVKRIDKVAPVVTGVQDGVKYRGGVTFNINDQNFNKLFVNDTQVAVTHTGGWDYAPVNQLSGDGTYVIKATDKGGNETILTIEITNKQLVTFNDIDKTTDTPTVSGTLTYEADGTVVSNAPLVLMVDGTDQYPITTDEAGNWSTPILVNNGSHTITLSQVNSDTTSTLLAETTLDTTFTPVANQPTPQGQPASGQPSNQPVGNPASNNSASQFPAAVSPALFSQVLGDSTANDTTDDTTGTPAVEGTSTEKNLAEAATANTDGKAFGLAWYWWLLIVAGVMTLAWWIVSAVRSSRAQG